MATSSGGGYDSLEFWPTYLQATVVAAFVAISLLIQFFLLKLEKVSWLRHGQPSIS